MKQTSPIKIIIVGATSGIGRSLAQLYASNGHQVGVTGRRKELLDSLQLEYPDHIRTACFDSASLDAATHLDTLTRQLGGLDLLIYSAGYGEITDNLSWEIDKATVDVNVNGLLTAVHFSWQFFTTQGHGHLATISSIASKKGNRHSPAYSASKAFQSTYFQGLYLKARKGKIPLHITDIQPGFVDTKMAKGPGIFWSAPVDKAARQIIRAIEKKKWRVYITRRWWLIAQIGRWMPDWIYNKIG